ncbi:MAG: hypothetical protein AUK03_10265 [Anaerolineae bacterium CG2_30_64_16]|nr:MAG: hypothetical protein AUK03_10265 [Anaerolineae bacterium CG2_30_64_16]
MSSESILNRIEKEAQKALIQNAFFRLESAVMIAGTVLLSIFLSRPFSWWPWWGWPVLGLIGEIAVVVSSLTDKAEQQKAVESLFRAKYNTAGIRDRSLRAKLDEADEYRKRIQQAIDQQRSGLLRDRLVDTTAQVYDWIANMVLLARRIDAYRADIIIKRDRETVPREIKELDARRKLEANPRVLTQMETTLASKQQLQRNLEELDNRMERADLQLDHSLAALGTMYSQTLLIGSKDVDSDRADRLRGDIRDEVSALQDIVESLNEVYTYEPGIGEQPVAKSVRRQRAGRAG